MKTNYTKPLSTIYLEVGAEEYSLTKKIISHFKKAQIISINSYQELFNRNRQDFREQKLSPKLILAVKNDSFLYPGSSFTPDFAEQNFFYNAMALNCLYDCSYCYLQGMFNSANLVIFVNQESFYQAATEKLQALGSLYLSISYDTDLLALEHLTGFCQEWIKLCAAHQNLLVECRTKSVNFKSISGLPPVDNFILSWTISPESVSREIESGTPSLSARIKAIQEAQALGWKIRICLDPLLIFPNWQTEYQSLITLLMSQLKIEQIRDISIGSFRMNQSYYKKIQKMRPTDKLFIYPYQQEQQVIGYPDNQDQHLKNTVIEYLLSANFPKEKIFCL